MDTAHDKSVEFVDAAMLARRLTMPDAIASMVAAFGDDVENPARTLLGRSFFMPGRVGKFTGIKVVSTKPGNPVGTVAVYDADGTPVGTVDGAAITSIRTGAGSGLATQLLAREDATSLAMLGAGKVSADQIEAVCCARKIQRVQIWSRRIEAAQALVSLMNARRQTGTDYLDGVQFAVANDANEAVRKADIVSCATPAKAPLFQADSVQPGTHINAVGAFTPDMVEIPASIVLRARVYVDDRPAAAREAGDLIQAKCTEFQTISDLLRAGAAPGRRSRDDITLFKSVGIASQDVASAVVALLGVEALAF